MANEWKAVTKKAVIWDMDGVIVDTEAYHFGAWRKRLQEEGIEFTENDFKRTFGMRNPEIIRTILGEDVTEDVIRRLANGKEEYFRQFVSGNLMALPGAVDLMKGLREGGFLQAVASSAPKQNIELVMRSLEISRFFPCLVSGDEVSAGKPDPQIFLLAAKRLGVEPRKCVVIEDSVAGVQAAVTGGMKCVAVATTHPPERLVPADIVVASLERIKATDIAWLVVERRP